MFAIAQKEFLDFFSDFVGLIIALFFISTFGLPLFILKGSYNIFDSGIGDLQLFFDLAPWILMIVCPAIGMKSFSEEYRSNTISLLFSYPIDLWKIILGKFLGLLYLLIFMLIPTIIYALVTHSILKDKTQFDWGIIFSSYIGLLLIGSLFLSISLWVSSLFKNQISSFVFGFILCLFQFYAWEEIATFINKSSHHSVIKQIGIYYYFNTLSKGILSIRGISYFLIVNVLFLLFVHLKLKKRIQ